MEIHHRLPVVSNRLALLLSIIIFSCNSKPKLLDVDPGFSKYIEAYTSGAVSKKSTIRIQLAADAATTHTLNENIKETLFEFSPAVSGKAYWIDARTLEFKPDKDLEAGTLYQVAFKLEKVINVAAAFKTFKFNIQTLQPSFEVNEFGLKAIGKEEMTFSGELNTADEETSANVEQLLSAYIGNTNLKINWQHNEVNKTHGFIIPNIKRTKSEQLLKLQWNGDAIQSVTKGESSIAVPAIGDFKVLAVRAVQEQEQYALVQFSEPIANGQILNGLITISSQENLSNSIQGSEIKIYTSAALDGSFTVTVHAGILNQWGEKLTKTFTSNVYFENRMPAVAIQGKGSILPGGTGKLLLPFEAINLSAVDVSIIKIYETNIAQFLQSNSLNGDEDLRRVAKPLTEATIRLDQDKTLNLHKKNHFSLDLDKYIKTEPGAIYRVTIGFRPSYSLYPCDSMQKDDSGEDYVYEDEFPVDEDENFWNRYDDYYPYGYNWDEREDPCFSSYYNKERFASRNILASNIGLTAKRSTDGNLFIAVSDIISAGPLNNVTLEVLDYQQQIIGKATSDADGRATIALKRKPYLLIAKQGNERGYLKLDDGSSLALGRFDVGGEEVKNGIKGFIFGERGVWRPGDSLFLSCIINDQNNKLPADYPLEMELISPRGLLYKRLVQTNANEGFNVFRTATDAGAPTGNWTCKVKAGGAVFTKTIKIETVIPNRLKIDLDFGNQEALGKDAAANGTLSAKWLFGATAQNLKARVDAQLYKKTTVFPKFKDYIFDNPTASFNAQSKTIFDGSLSAEGTAVINPAFTVNSNAPGQLLANLLVKVFEPGGNFSIDNIAMPFNPFSSYIGVHLPKGDKNWGYLESGKSHRFDIADVDTKGNPMQGNTMVEAELYKIQWRWWWDNGYNNELSNFTQDQYNTLIKKDTLNVQNGKGFYDIKMPKENWGRYLILLRDKRSGHVTGTTFYLDDNSWQNRGGNNDASAAAMLSFSSDKEKYEVGDQINITIPSSKDAHALISIESGSKVVKTFWVKTTQGQTKFSFKAEKEMSPNIYVNISLLQPHAQTINDLPIRMYGVIPVMVEDKNSILKPQIKMADIIKPEENTNITVSESSGKKMTYVIALVDEGLLDLTRFKTPNPHDAFYAREALGIKSWDIFDDVIGAWGGQIERILTIGGDGEADIASKTRKANRFLPVVKFMGPFTLNGGSNTHSFKLPSYMGSIRAMVIASGSSAYGMAQKSVTVKKPLMLLATLPRVLGPGEEIKIPVTVFATENNIKNVALSIQTNPFIESAGNQTINFSKAGEQLVYFTARVKPNTGIGAIKISATSGTNQDVFETAITIRNPNAYATQVSEATLQPGKSFNGAITMIGDAGSSKAVVEISSLPAINLTKRINYLIQYPHGCIEQTTSSVFPQLVLNQMMELNEKQKADIDRNIAAAIQKLQNFQQRDGGFSYWPGGRNSDEWGTSYAGNFLLEASNRGYNVPSAMLQQWKQFERSKALAWNVTTAPWYGTDLEQAYRLYLLAAAKTPEVGAMNRLKEFRFLSPESKWRLAAAYYLLGQTNVALQMISGLPTSFAERTEPGVTYGSNFRDQAMVLESLSVMGRKAEAAQLVKLIAANLSQDNWYSTQTTSYALIAIAKYCGANKNGEKIVLSGKVNADNVSISSAANISQHAVIWQNGKASIQLKNNGSNTLYVRIINEGKPLNSTPLPITVNPNILRVAVSFLTTTGKIIMPDSIKQGTDFVAKVTIKNPGNRGVYNQMALTEVFPGGWEILNTRLYNSEGAFQSSPSDYMDLRDDRVYQYFNIGSGETLTYYVQLNAAYPGKYLWPGIYAEAMYDHSISGGVSGKWVKVIP